MSAAIVNLTERRPVPLSDEVVRRIAAFLAAGNTGRITLNVKCGEVRHMEVIESIDVKALDDMAERVGRSTH